MQMLLIFLAYLISTAFGCGELPRGLERNLTFTVTGFTLNVAMIWTADNGVAAQLPTILRSGRAVQAFVQRQIMDSIIYEVLEEQGRSAGLSLGAILAILEQLTVMTNYQPLQCEFVNINLMPNNQLMFMANRRESCYIQGNMVNRLCRRVGAMCEFMAPFTDIIEVPSEHLTITGTLTVRNPIMAGWSTQMWQSILNRVLRSLASGPLSSSFNAAVVTVNR